MGNYQKGICDTWTELKTRLTSLGFVMNVAENKMWWGQDGQSNNPQSYWALDNDKQTINFHASQKVFPNDVESGTIAQYYAFHDPLVHMNSTYSPDTKTKAGFIFIELLGHGCILYLTPIEAENTTTEQLYFSCYIDKQQTHSGDDKIKNNGVVVCTPTEQDGYCRYSWRHDAAYPTEEMLDGLYPFDSSDQTHDRTKLGFFRWDIDNTQGFVSIGTELPQAELINADMSIAMVMSYLVNGYWSSNIYYMVTGAIDQNGAGLIFQINNQYYMVFTDNNLFRCPIFKLPIENIQQNISTSTEGYSEYKLYAVGDYCVHDDLLYRCIREINQPGPFDDGYWTVTTVYEEEHGN